MAVDPDIEILLNNLMKDYRSKISRTFKKQDFENFLKRSLMGVMKSYNMKPRGNIARLVAAVLALVSLSGFEIITTVNSLDDIFPNYWFQPSDLCYTINSSTFDRKEVIKFSFDDGNVDLVTVSGIYYDMPHRESELVYKTVLDLKRFAAPLIECLHGGIADSSEVNLLELCSQVHKDICVPLLARMRYDQLQNSDCFKQLLRIRNQFRHYVLDLNNNLG